MKATFISKEGNEAKFKMEFTAEDLENAVIKAYQATKDRYSVDGFRKGKAPRSIIEKHYGENIFMDRLNVLTQVLSREIEILNIEEDISSKIKSQMNQNQKEYYLREQMRAIQEELGVDEEIEDEIDEWEKQIKELGLPEKTEAVVEKEIKRMSKMQPSSSEASVSRTYIETILSLPWNKESEMELDLKKAEKILNEDHWGLEKVKERVLEYLAVIHLSQTMKGPILCLVGPPGTGKTSIVKSIARATGREYVRMSLGGVRDEAEIRGHRRTYIGAIPGRVINCIKEAGTKNPVFLFDEVDKLGADFRGDPASALLEVLDPEQNKNFTDHYLEVPFDLSKVMREAVKEGSVKKLKSTSGLTGGDAYKMKKAAEKGSAMCGGLFADAIAKALSVSELNAAMGRIVAAPTAGSCGILPGALIAYQKDKNADEKDCVMSMFTASAVGMVINNNACLAGAGGGCQAECGSASAMAAAALTELAGGSPEMAENAAAIALKNILGLVCDPVAGLVEIPCIKRNAGGVANALCAAEMALAGICSKIPADEVIVAMIEAGKITNSRKRLNKGKGVFGCALGTQRLFDFIDRNPVCVSYPINYVNSPAVMPESRNRQLQSSFGFRIC